MAFPRYLYFIDRGRDRPDWHKAPYHRYLICTNVSAAYWEAGWTGNGASLWMRHTTQNDGSGWLLLRWKGLDIDYGGLVKGGDLFDGGCMGFVHPHRPAPPWSVLAQAVWWSTRTIPPWLRDMGIAPPSDPHSLDSIRQPPIQADQRNRRQYIVGADAEAIADFLEETGHAEACHAVRQRFFLQPPPLDGDQGAALPLSDALEECGVTGEMVEHFRVTPQCPRGCHFLDTILGKP